MSKSAWILQPLFQLRHATIPSVIARFRLSSSYMDEGFWVCRDIEAQTFVSVSLSQDALADIPCFFSSRLS